MLRKLLLLFAEFVYFNIGWNGYKMCKFMLHMGFSCFQLSVQTIGTRLHCQRMDATVEEIIGLKKTTPTIGFKSGQ